MTSTSSTGRRRMPSWPGSLLLVLAAVLVWGCAQADRSGGGLAEGRADRLADLAREVTETERAFARTMADRDHGAFQSFIADEAIFFAGDTPLRGRAAVAAAWKPYFDSPAPPFSWEPDRVEVLESGSLAMSSGPIYDPGGTITGRFNSVWRREASGRWRIVFDSGCPVCAAPSRDG